MTQNQEPNNLYPTGSPVFPAQGEGTTNPTDYETVEGQPAQSQPMAVSSQGSPSSSSVSQTPGAAMPTTDTEQASTSVPVSANPASPTPNTSTPSIQSPSITIPYGNTTQGTAQAAVGVQGSAPQGYGSPGGPVHSHGYQGSSPSNYGGQAAMPPTGHQGSGQAKHRSGGGGKTFVLGFLGALLACILCIGCFGLFGGFKGTPGTSTVLGASDSTVINAVEDGQSLSEAVAAKALPSVVGVYNYQEGSPASYFGYGASDSSGELSAAGMGSGVIISEDGYILTNYHVVEGAKVVRVTVDGIERDAKYIGGDSSSDVAVVKVDDTEGMIPADIGNSDNLIIGEFVMTIGAPLGLEQSVATGVVSATNRSTIMDNSSDNSYPYGSSSSSPDYTYYPNMIQTDAVINPGNSGGALVDADGKLIGINTMISSYSGDYAGVGFAIPVNYAMGIASDIIAGKTPTHAMLGVTISTVNAQTAQRYGFQAESGAYISAITPGTGAANSGLQVGDIITAIDGETVASATDVTLAIRSHAVGQTVTVTVDRNGSSHDVEVTLSSDENLLSNGSPSPDNDTNDQGQSSPYDNGPRDEGQNQRNIEDLLRLFGM